MYTKQLTFISCRNRNNTIMCWGLLSVDAGNSCSWNVVSYQWQISQFFQSLTTAIGLLFPTQLQIQNLINFSNQPCVQKMSLSDKEPWFKKIIQKLLLLAQNHMPIMSHFICPPRNSNNLSISPYIRPPTHPPTLPHTHPPTHLILSI